MEMEMAQIENVTGKKFGRLTALSFSKIENKRTYWKFLCECGNIKEMLIGNVKRGVAKSCGCLGADNIASSMLNKTFGRLVVIAKSSKKSLKKVTFWVCFCSCGKAVEVETYSLRRGITKSCGCLQKEAVSAHSKRHGKINTPEYSSWQHMRQRCNNVDGEFYADYGGRGIKICDRWQVGDDGKHPFVCFLEDVGEKPQPKNIYSLDRIDVNGNYEPENCRWATYVEQSYNKRDTAYLTHLGETLTFREWSERVGIPYSVLLSRIRSLKWEVEKAFTTPVRKRDKSVVDKLT